MRTTNPAISAETATGGDDNEAAAGMWEQGGNSAYLIHGVEAVVERTRVTTTKKMNFWNDIVAFILPIPVKNRRFNLNSGLFTNPGGHTSRNKPKFLQKAQDWWVSSINPSFKNWPKIVCRVEPTTTLKLRKTFRPLKTIVRIGADFNTQLGVWQFKSSWEDAIIGGKLTLAGKELQLTKSWQLSVGECYSIFVLARGIEKGYVFARQSCLRLAIGNSYGRDL